MGKRSEMNDGCGFTKYYATAENVNFADVGPGGELPWGFSVAVVGTVVGKDEHGNDVTFAADELNRGQIYPAVLSTMVATGTATGLRFWFRG